MEDRAVRDKIRPTLVYVLSTFKWIGNIKNNGGTRIIEQLKCRANKRIVDDKRE